MAKRRSDGGKKTIGYRVFSRILTDAQNPGGIQHCQDGNAYISEYGHPHGGQPQAPNTSTTALIPSAKTILNLAMDTVRFASFTACGRSLSLSDTSTTSAASIAASVPSPMATPTSAMARTGASFMPSPTKTVEPLCLICSRWDTLSAGRSSAQT